MEDGTSAGLPGLPLNSAGFGASLGRCLSAELYQALLACSLEFSSSPGQKRAEPTTPYQVLLRSSSTSCSHKICPAHPQALRAAEGPNPMVPVRNPSLGLFLSAVSFPLHSPLRVPRRKLPPVGTGSPGSLGPETLGFHSRKDSRMLPSWGSPRAV